MLVKQNPETGEIIYDEMGMKREYFDCICGATDHIMVVTYFQDEDGMLPDGEIYFDLQFNPDRRWWERVFVAIRYILGIKHQSSWGECIIKPNDVPRLKALLENLEKSPPSDD